MFQVKYCLPIQDWQIQRFKVGGKTLIEAWAKTYGTIRELVPEVEIDFIPLGNFAFLIWGDKKCQGYISIEKVPATASVPDRGNGS